MALRLAYLPVGLVIIELILAQPLRADEVDDLKSLANADNTPTKSLVLNPKSSDARYHVAAGISYTGLQLRYQFSQRWAAEARAQFGTAESHYGDVNATVVGLRGCRFIPYRRNLSWYLGGEIGHAEATADHTNYAVDGFVGGAFGGLEYRILPRLAVGMDIGPYAISLKEKQTGLTQTTLDFVVNTALNFYIF